MKRVKECLYVSKTGIYYARIGAGGRKWKSLNTKVRARADKELSKLRYEAGHIPHTHSVTDTIGELADRYVESMTGKDTTLRTARWICRVVKETFPGGPDRRITKIKHSDVALWLAEVSKAGGIATWNKHVTFIRKMFSLAVNDGALPANPAGSFKYRRVPTPDRPTPTWNEAHNIITWLKDSPIKDLNLPAYNDHKRAGELLEFFTITGQGNGEAALIKRKDIDLESLMITFTRMKTGRRVTLPMTPMMEKFFRQYFTDHKFKHEDHLFDCVDIQKSLNRACTTLKIPRYTHRAFRRCFASEMTRRGMSFKITAMYLCHTDGGKLVADTYSHLTTDDVRTAVKVMA